MQALVSSCGPESRIRVKRKCSCSGPTCSLKIDKWVRWKFNLIPDDEEYCGADEAILGDKWKEVIHAIPPQVAQDASLPQAGPHLLGLVDAQAAGVQAAPHHVDLHLIVAVCLFGFYCCRHLLNQLLEPDAKVCCNKMDQAEPACPLPLVQVHPVVEEEEVGLEEDEDDLGCRSDCKEEQTVAWIAS